MLCGSFGLMKIKELKTENDFLSYSEKLKSFETEFNYPLGEKRFLIQHGNEDFSYFEFFKRLGKPFYFIIKDNNEIICAGCAVLRNINYQNKNEKIWYLCDFKIKKEYRKKGLLKKLIFRYFIKHYFKTSKMIAVNMSAKDNNGLVKKVHSLFSFFNVKTVSLFFYEFNKDKMITLLNNEFIKNNFVLMTNRNYKDIYIENTLAPIYHLVNKNYAIKNFNGLYKEINENNIKILEKECVIMYATINKNNIETLLKYNINYDYQSSFISHKINLDKIEFSSFEI